MLLVLRKLDCRLAVGEWNNRVRTETYNETNNVSWVIWGRRNKQDAGNICWEDCTRWSDNSVAMRDVLVPHDDNLIYCNTASPFHSTSRASWSPLHIRVRASIWWGPHPTHSSCTVQIQHFLLSNLDELVCCLLNFSLTIWILIIKRGNSYRKNEEVSRWKLQIK